MMDAATWKRGLTRVYVAAWIVWATCIAAAGVTYTSPGGSPINAFFSDDGPVAHQSAARGIPAPIIARATLAGIVLPTLLLLLLRWVFDGFTKPSAKPRAGSPAILVLICATSLLTAGCKDSTAPAPQSNEPVLAFTRWSAITVSGGTGLALGWCKNIGTVTAYHVIASSCLDNTAWNTSQTSIAPGDSANFWHPAVDSSGVWVYPSCVPHIGGVSNP